MGSFLSFQIKRLHNSQLFIVEEDFASRACDLVVEFGHGAGLEEFFGAGVATCTDGKRTTLLVNDFLSILVQLKTVISCQFLRSLAQHKRLLILGRQLVWQLCHRLNHKTCIWPKRLRAALFNLLRKKLRLEAILALSYLDVRWSCGN